MRFLGQAIEAFRGVKKGPISGLGRQEKEQKRGRGFLVPDPGHRQIGSFGLLSVSSPFWA